MVGEKEQFVTPPEQFTANDWQIQEFGVSQSTQLRIEEVERSTEDPPGVWNDVSAGRTDCKMETDFSLIERRIWKICFGICVGRVGNTGHGVIINSLRKPQKWGEGDEVIIVEGWWEAESDLEIETPSCIVWNLRSLCHILSESISPNIFTISGVGRNHKWNGEVRQQAQLNL